MSQAPYRSPIESAPGIVATPWRHFFNDLFTSSFAIKQSGTTAQRPTVGLWAGRPYFDTTLGQPIWYDGSGWVDATGVSA